MRSSWLAPERLARPAALSGVGFAVLAAASRLTAPVPVLPEIDAGGLVRSYYLNYRGALLARGVLWGLGVVLAVVFLAVLASRLQQAAPVDRPPSAQEPRSRRPVDRWLPLAALGAGGLALASSSLSVAALGAVIEYRQDEVLGATGDDSGGAVALFELYEALDRLSGYPAVALLLLVSLAVLSGEATALGGRVLPRWFGWAGLAAAVPVLAAAVGVRVTGSGALAHAAMLAWVAAGSLLLAGRPERTRAAPQGR